MTKGKTVHLTGEMMIGLILAFLGFIGTTAGTMLHLNVRTVVQGVDIKISAVRAEFLVGHKDVQLSIEQLKAKMSEAEIQQYKQIMQETRATFANAELMDAKHEANSARLDTLATGQVQMSADLRSFRDSIEKRLLQIEERLPA